MAIQDVVQIRATCSSLTRERGVSLLGTAPCAGAFVVVECRKPWEAKVEKSTDYPEDLKDVVKRAGKGADLEPKIFARPSSRPAGSPREIRVYRRMEDGRVTLARVAHDGSRAAEERLARALAEPGGVEAPPVLFVCTHGSRDRCCGTLGYRFAEAMREAAGDGLEVLECSHLGGHRFAPTVLALPSWRLYGQVTPEEAPDLAAHLRRGTVLPGRHRGACWLEEEEQVLEGAPWERLGEPLRAVRILDSHKVEGGRRAVVEVRRPDGSSARYRVSYRETEYAAVASCADLPDGKTKKMSEFRILECEPQG